MECFYSKLVRLKEFCQAIMKAVIASFYSKLVRLKACLTIEMSKGKVLFLFQIGSIKRNTTRRCASLMRSSFYSKLVRLKVYSQWLITKIQNTFLFQIGSIKRAVSGILLVKLKVFLFQIGSIKRNFSPPLWFRFQMFLFQIGSIKSITGIYDTPITSDVSIPNWFD